MRFSVFLQTGHDVFDFVRRKARFLEFWTLTMSKFVIKMLRLSSEKADQSDMQYASNK